MAKSAANQAIGIAAMHHDRANRGGIGAHNRLGQIRGHALARHNVVVGVPVIKIARIVFGVHDLHIDPGADFQTGAFAPPLNHLGAANQDRLVGGFFHNRLGGAQHALILALGKHDAALGGAGGVKDRAHDHGGFEHRAVEPGFIGVQIGDRAGRDAGFNRCARHGTGHNPHQARIKRFGDQVIDAKGEFFANIYRSGLGACGHARQLGDAFDAGDFHLVVDVGGPHIQRATKDKRKAQHVVHLIGKIRATGGDNRLGVHGAGRVGVNFRIGVGQRENNRRIGHFCDHLGFQHAGSREPEEHVRPANHIIQCRGRCALRIVCFLRGHIVFAAMIHKALDIT